MTVPLPVICGENIAGYHSVRRRVGRADWRFEVQAVQAVQAMQAMQAVLTVLAVLAEWRGLPSVALIDGPVPGAAQ